MATDPNSTPTDFDLEATVRQVLDQIERPRDREIITRRLGLFAPRATLEEIGNDLNLTRERIRQLEKSILTRLQKRVSQKNLDLGLTVSHFKTTLRKTGNVSRLNDFVKALQPHKNQRIHQAQVAFLASLSPQFALIGNSNDHHAGIGLIDHHTSDQVYQHIDAIIDQVDSYGQPLTIDQLRARYHLSSSFSGRHLHGLASLSKRLYHLDGLWGLHKWPSVNPRNISDKVRIILKRAKKPLHFAEIANRIRSGAFRRNQVTVQAIHNELIKGDDFVLVGRGIYALKDWGYQPGTVADVIGQIISRADKPLTKAEIVKAVAGQRQVKDTTIALNLQNKKLFIKDSQGCYRLAPGRA